MCHKLDAVTDLTTVSRGKPDDLHPSIPSVGNAQNFRCSLLIADKQDLFRQSGDDIGCLQTIETRRWTLPGGKYTGTLLAILNRTASVD